MKDSPLLLAAVIVVVLYLCLAVCMAGGFDALARTGLFCSAGC